MNDKRFIAGIALFFVGGAVLAFGGGSDAATGLGTTVGLAGVVLFGWAWLSGREAGE